MKPKRKRRHLDSSYSIKSAEVSRGLNLQEDVWQNRQKSVHPLKPSNFAGASRASDYFVSISSEDELIGSGKEELLNRMQRETCRDSTEKVEFTSSCFAERSKGSGPNSDPKLCEISSTPDDVVYISPEDDLKGDVSELQAVVEASASGPTAREYLLPTEVLMEDFFVSTHPHPDVDVDAAQPQSGVKVTESGQREEDYSSPSEDLTWEYSASTHSYPDEDGKEHTQVGSLFGQEMQLSCLARCLLISLSPQTPARAKTPEWLVAPDRGFKCMACCRVFPSLQVLQEHVEYGVTEGFSCHVFYHAMARLNHKKQKEEKRKLKKATRRCQKEVYFGMKTTPFN
ncbi:protein FAM170A-like [Saccopteryx leptura]|uniref:protein FAM170A-like n=1 Tax=Saccopteryx leptura TaxID=249018 RepID=UPI00339C2BCF